MKRSLVILLFLSLFLASNVIAATIECDSVSSCNSAISGASSGDVILMNQSIVVESGGDGIDFNSKGDIILDCNGFVLDGDKGFGSSGISGTGFDNVTIRNCNVTDFYFGMYLYSMTNGKLENINATSNTNRGIYFTGGSSNITMDKIITANNYATDISLSGSNFIVSNVKSELGSFSINDRCIYAGVSNSSFTNISVSKANYGIAAFGSSNNFTNITSTSNRYSMQLARGNGSRLSESNFSNNTYNFYLDPWGSEIESYDWIIDSSNIVDYDKKIYYNYSISDYEFNPINAPDAGVVVCVYCDNITVRDLNLSGKGYDGLHFFNTTDSKIINITSSGNSNGIFLQESSRNNITNSKLTSNLRGVNVYYNSYNNTLENLSLINGGSVSYGGYGIYFMTNTSGSFLKDIIFQDTNGLDLSFSLNSESDCDGYNFNNITGSGGRPIGFYNAPINLQDLEFSQLILCNADNSTLDNITVRGSDNILNNIFDISFVDNSNFSNIDSSYNYWGIVLYSSMNNNFQNISTFGNDNYGFYIDHKSDYNIINNLTSSNNIHEGLRIYSDYNFVSNSKFSNNSNGVLFMSYSTYFPQNNTFVNIISEYNNQNGFYIYKTMNNLFSNVTSSFSYGSHGFRFYNSSNNTITNSIVVSNNQSGISFQEDSVNNVINTTVIENNSDYGLNFYSYLNRFYPGYNKIYDNVLNNTINYYNSVPDLVNYFNTTNTSGTNVMGGPYIGGNFWDNYSAPGTLISGTCSDEDLDGFCDSQTYNIEGDNYDYLPLMDHYIPQTYECDSVASCNFVINSSNSRDTIIMNQSITYFQNGTAINITGKEDITFDCQGFGLVGPGNGNTTNYGIYVDYENTVVSNCNITGFYRGVYLNSSNSTVENLSTSNSDTGVYVYSGVGNVMNNITSILDNDGVYVYSGSDNILSNSFIDDSLIYGLTLSETSDNILVNVTVSNSGSDGVYLLTSSNNTLTNITSSSNDRYGIHIARDSDRNILNNSFIKNNSDTGLYFEHFSIYYPENNTIYNNIINNTVNYYNSSVLTNYFNTTKTFGTNIINDSYIAGNFWDNWSNPGTGPSYNCTDVNADEICDSAYSIDGVNYDYLPLSGVESSGIQCNSCGTCSGYIQNATLNGTVIKLTENLTDVVGNCIEFYYKDNIVFDCNGNYIDGDDVGTDYGIYMNWTSGSLGTYNSIVRNCNVSQFFYGFNMIYSRNNTIENSSFNDNRNTGIYFNNVDNSRITNVNASGNGEGAVNVYGIIITNGASDNNVTNVFASNNTGYGIYLNSVKNSLYNLILENNTYGLYAAVNDLNIQNSVSQENTQLDVSFSASSDTMCRQNWINVTGSGGRPIGFYNTSVNIQDQEFSELILCNADNSILDNVTVRGSDSLQNNGLYVFLTNYTQMSNINSSNNYVGIDINRNTYYSNYTNITVNGNKDIAFDIDNSKFINITNLEANYNTYSSSAVSIWDCDGVRAYNINASYNVGDGIYFESNFCWEGMWVENITTNNNGDMGVVMWDFDCFEMNNIEIKDNVGTGLYMGDSEWSILRNWTVVNNSYGMYIDGDSDSNEIHDSNISFNRDYAIYFDGWNPDPNNNLFYNNYIDTEKGIYVSDPGFGNDFYDTLTLRTNIVGGPYIGGNYWANSSNISGGFSDNCIDTDVDGICDSSYNIPEGEHTDIYPLAAPPVLNSSNAFTFQINITSDNQIFSFQSDSSDLMINWSDGNVSTYSGTGLVAHNYSTAGIYDISVQGTASRISFYEGTPSLLIDILSPLGLGISGINNAQFMFRDAGNITNFTAQNWFDSVSGNVTSMYFMFNDATNFNQDISSWNTGNVSDFNSMFYNAVSFNQPLNSWNTSAATDMQFMFDNASSFNQNLSSWDVSGVSTMNYMFGDATNFNGNISTWDTSSVTNMYGMFNGASSFNQPLNSWNVGNVIIISEMFNGATSFNQPLDNWDVSWVGSLVQPGADMRYMFANASSFDQNLSSWDVSLSYGFDDMFTGSNLSTPNYDSILIGWNELGSLRSGLTLGVGSTMYSSEANASRQNIVDTYSWTINDGGLYVRPPATFECDSFSSCNASIFNSISGDVIKLNNSISNYTDTFILLQGKDDITFDCQWNTIDGDGSASYGIYFSYVDGGSDNVTIKNCIITDFQIGIYLDTSSTNNTLVNIQTLSSGNIGLSLGSSYNNITNLTSSYNYWYGIHLYNGENNTFSDSVLSYNSEAGLYVDNAVGPYDGNVFDNVLFDSNKYGAYLEGYLSVI